MDEARVGLIPNYRRLWGVKGEDVRVPFGMKFQWRYAVTVGEVQRGELKWAWWERVGQAYLESFLKDLRKEHPEEYMVMLWDRAGWHRGIEIPEGMVGVELPVGSPELNPAELIVRKIRGVTANGWWEEIEAKVRVAEEELSRLAPDKEGMRKMLAFAWIVAQIEGAKT